MKSSNRRKEVSINGKEFHMNHIINSKWTRVLIMTTICLMLILSTAISAFAMDKRVTASGTWKKVAGITKAEADAHSVWVKDFLKGQANGYITSSTKHYANEELFLLGQHVKYSGQKWGTGKVSVSTGWGYSVCAIVDLYGSAVWYGF